MYSFFCTEHVRWVMKMRGLVCFACYKTRSLLATPAHLLATPAHLLATPAHVLATPAHLLATPAHLLATPAQWNGSLRWDRWGSRHRRWGPCWGRCRCPWLLHSLRHKRLRPPSRTKLCVDKQRNHESENLMELSLYLTLNCMNYFFFSGR